MKVKHRSRLGSLWVAADEACLVSRAGAALVPELAARCSDRLRPHMRLSHKAGWAAQGGARLSVRLRVSMTEA